MAFALIVNAGAGSSDGNNVTTAEINTTGADFLVAVVASQPSVAEPAFTDSKGNTWITAPPTSKTVVSQIRGTLYYCKNPSSVGSSHTVSAAQTGSTPAVDWAAFSGGHLTAPFDQEAGATDGSGGSGTPTLNTGSITPSEGNELIISWGAWDANTATAAVNSGLSITNQQNYSGGLSKGIALAYKIQTTATSINPQWSWNNFLYLAAAVASFKSAAGGGGGGGSAIVPIVLQAARRRL